MVRYLSALWFIAFTAATSTHPVGINHLNYTALAYYTEYSSWVTQFNRTYADPEDLLDSYTTFVDRYDVYQKTAQAPPMPYTLELNERADHPYVPNIVMRIRTRSPNYRGYRTPDPTPKTFWKMFEEVILSDIEMSGLVHSDVGFDYSHTPLPESFDWSAHIPMRVPDQKNCGACFCFAATGALEGAYYLKHNLSVKVSEGQVVDCSQKYGNHGCEGGEMVSVFKYWMSFGAQPESDYPYVPRDMPCTYNRSDVLVKVRSYAVVPPGGESLKRALVNHGPLSVGMDASSVRFQMYRSGVYSDPECSNTELDHGVLLVGYGVSVDGVKYWKVRNSWGSSSWGVSGFFLIDMAYDCGISQNGASYPVL